MEVGVTIFPTEYAMAPVELGRTLEALGFESLFVTEHTHIPAGSERTSPYGESLRRDYWHTFDPFVALASVAATTERLVVGTGICLVVERDPIVLAKEVATLDVLSGGRFVLGIGGGWNRAEMENHGTAYEERWEVVRERVLAMKEIWASDEATFAGRHVRFERIWQWPKPLQRPHPPILLGAASRGTFARVVEYCDGWMPGGSSGADLTGRIERLRRLAAEAGRPRPLVTVWGCPERAEVLERHAAAGIDRVLFEIPSEPEAQLVPRLERLAALAGGALGR